jgi:uncharacterized membrane protein YeaQ/YmgE (transglycosylase-associated protein family)
VTADQRLGAEAAVLWFLVLLLSIGLVAGIVARLLVPGRDPMSVGATVLLGIVGSFIGGFLGYALFEHDIESGALQPSGLFGSIVGAVLALFVHRAMTRRARPVRRRLRV